MASSSMTTNMDTLVTLKINIEGSNRKFKLPLRDLGANVLPERLRFLLAIPPTSHVIFERYSDSAAAFVTLDSSNASVYKQLYRAAKAKLKLRLKVTVIDMQPAPQLASVEDEVAKESELQHHPSSPVSPPAVQAAEVIKQNDETSSPSVAEIQRSFEELLVNSNSVGARQASSIPISNPKPIEFPDNAIPVTHGPIAREKFFADVAGIDAERQTALLSKCGHACHESQYSVFCNNCQNPIPDQHYHCSTCDDGDYDLCQSCIDNGVLCGGDGHWMIKRFVKNGKVINSTTETLPPRKSFAESKVTLVSVEDEEQHDEHVEETLRTCNSCIQDLPVENFVTCTACDDFDLCIPCHENNEHGHHPKHAFKSAVENAKLSTLAVALLKPGRNASHFAFCDGCDMAVYGVRHKCLDCPDWDYCSECIVNAPFIHPGHRFAPIYEPLGDTERAHAHYHMKVRHHGIYCDGPLCNTKSGVSTYIQGDRYKCAVCHDTDFCASCEASPANTHNKTHPLIKFKTPVRNVSVTTMGDHDNGQTMPIMGDRRASTLSRYTETACPISANAATQVRTVADLFPLCPVLEPKTEEPKPESAEPSALIPETEFAPKVEPVAEAKPVCETPKLNAETKPAFDDDLVAHFVRDTVPDGTVIQANSVFEQTWVMRNDGTTAWPAGCTVKFVGGDNMCAVDPEHPASVHELVSAAESTTCYAEVAPGQEFGFTVLMRTPNHPGKVISYWRLTGPNGDRFGHRLWCDVTVSPAPAVKSEAKQESIEEPKKSSDVQSSQMIFPKLENESPLSSIHRDAPATVASSAVSELGDDDFESAASFEDDETEDGFLTDEEYDILDASDEEYLTEQSKHAKN